MSHQGPVTLDQNRRTTKSALCLMTLEGYIHVIYECSIRVFHYADCSNEEY